MAEKKLYRSQKNKVLAGICGGIGERFGIDPTIVRVIWVVISFFLGYFIGGLVLYIILIFIIPQEPDYFDV